MLIFTYRSTYVHFFLYLKKEFVHLPLLWSCFHIPHFTKNIY